MWVRVLGVARDFSPPGERPWLVQGREARQEYGLCYPTELLPLNGLALFLFFSDAGTAHIRSFCSCFVCSLVIDFYFEGLVEKSTCTPAWLFCLALLLLLLARTESTLACISLTWNQHTKHHAAGASSIPVGFQTGIVYRLEHKPEYILVENVKGFEVSETRKLLVDMLNDCNYAFQVKRM